MGARKLRKRWPHSLSTRDLVDADAMRRLAICELPPRRPPTRHTAHAARPGLNTLTAAALGRSSYPKPVVLNEYNPDLSNGGRPLQTSRRGDVCEYIHLTTHDARESTRGDVTTG